MAVGDEIFLASDPGYKISIKFFPNRDKIRVAFVTNLGSYFFDSVGGLDTDNDIDLLDSFELMVSVDTVNNIQQLYMNKINKLDAGSVTHLAGALIPHEANTNLTIGGTPDSAFTEGLNGQMQETWQAAGFVDWSAHWNSFSPNGYPADLTVGGASPDYSAGTGVAPYVYQNGAVGVDFLNNKGSAGGGFTEVGTITEGAESPLYPGATPPVIISDDNTFTFVDGLLGDLIPIPPSNPGTTQQFLSLKDADRCDAIGSELQSQLLSSPSNDKSLRLVCPNSNASVGLKGGMFRGLDGYAATYDSLTTLDPSSVLSEIDRIVFDGGRYHNSVKGVSLQGRPGSDPATDIDVNEPPQNDDDPDAAHPPTNGYDLEMHNSWNSYVRCCSIDNNNYMNGDVSDSLFDGIYSFLSMTNATSTVDQANRTFYIRDSLIWLRRMPYPANHPAGGTLGTDPINSNDDDIWGHGNLFDVNEAYAPRLWIENSIFYIEDYGAQPGAYSTWSASAQQSIGFPDRIAYASNNQVIFGHRTDVYNPAWIPSAWQSEFTITNYSQNAAAPLAFFTARNNWIDAHPVVARSNEAIFDGPIDFTASTIKPYVPYPTF